MVLTSKVASPDQPIRTIVRWDAEDEELVDSARELLESADVAQPAAQTSE
jgi:hypothetical protein